MNSNIVDYTQYGGFQSYGDKLISTSKPGISNYYQKDAYKEISNYNKRRVSFYDDKIRWNSVYDKDVVKSVKEKDYIEGPHKNKTDLSAYEYCHDENLKQIVTEGRKKNEEGIRQKYAQSTNGLARKKMFSQWESTYDSENVATKKVKEESNFKQSFIPDQYKSKYHNYQKASYKTDYTQNFGIHGDNPQDKFMTVTNANGQVTNKLHYDNYDVGLGTTKGSSLIPGYSGHIPTNKTEPQNTLANDPYFKNAKTNHMLNYKTRVPNYSGYIPFNSKNIKGSVRANCLSVQGEFFS